MTVSISRMNINYYLSNVSVGDASAQKGKLTSYYTGSSDPAGTWYGGGLAGLSIAGESVVTQQDAISVYEELKNPNTGESLGHRPIETKQAPEGATTPSGRATKSDRKAVSGFDLTFSAPKSVSALWAVADAGTQSRIHTAHQNAVRDCLDWVENHVVQTRAGHGGAVKVPAEGIIASLFDHFDSRAGDPQMHTHAVLANRVQRVSDGKWVTLDSYTMHRWVVAVSEMYNNTLYDRLGTELGTLTEQREAIGNEGSVTRDNRQRRVEIAGVPDDLIAEFSTRALAINTRTDELIAEWQAGHDTELPQATLLEFRRQATLETREPKAGDKQPLSSRITDWQDRCWRLRLDPGKIVSAATGNHADTHAPEQLTEPAITEIAAHALERTASKHSTFTRANLTASAHRLLATVRFSNLEERNAITESVVAAATDQAVQLTPDRYNLDHQHQAGLTIRDRSVFNAGDNTVYTTVETMNRESQLIDAATDTTGPSVTDAERLSTDLNDYRSSNGFPLAEDQKNAAEQVITDKHSLSAIIGPAGTGKTTTLAGLRHVWENQNGTGSIIGLAPSAAAAFVLGQELGIPTDNVAKWLYESVGDGAAARIKRYQQLTDEITRLETQLQTTSHQAGTKPRLDAARTKLSKTIADQSKYQIKPGQMLIVDEASMSSTADLAQLHEQVTDAGGKLLLVGDPAQLDAVDAGGFLGWMETHDHAAHLKSIWRFENKDWEPEASLALRSGDTRILQEYSDQGRIHASKDGLDAAYTAWRADTAAGKDSVLIAGRNDQVQALNERAQTELVSEGTVNPEKQITVRYGNAYLGDLVLARKNNRQLTDESGEFVKNGTRLKLTEIYADHARAVRQDTGASITLPADYLADSVELGYASTAHRAQGLTVDTAHVAADESFGREQLYVAMTRGKAGNHVYLTEPDHDTDSTDTPDPWAMIRPIETNNVMETLSGIVKKSSAEKTAHDVQDAEHGWAKDLARHCSDLDYVVELSATRRAHSIAERLGKDPNHLAHETSMIELVQTIKRLDADVDDVPETVTTLTEATEHLKRTCTHTDQYQLIPTTTHPTGEEDEAQTQILSAINSRADTILQQEKDQPWARTARAMYPDELRNIAQWRALSDQDPENTDVLGQAPPENETRLMLLHQRMGHILETAHERRQDGFRQALDEADRLLADLEAQLDYNYTEEGLPILPAEELIDPEYGNMYEQLHPETAPEPNQEPTNTKRLDPDDSGPRR
ncbi:MobF family relaxase [uncultured Kocuria sp.]|uniref:MobF family relaxase n=1 Tax=uncultured Kocuria sp. TaxID=259305 RepID=UPI00259382B7|nr:MobF family relaxase [uncultured Kocuria sp.]